MHTIQKKGADYTCVLDGAKSVPSVVWGFFFSFLERLEKYHWRKIRLATGKVLHQSKKEVFVFVCFVGEVRGVMFSKVLLT